MNPTDQITRRIPSQEGIEDPEVTAAFARIARLPPMRLLRGYVVRRALRAVPCGDAADLGCGPGDLAVELAQRASGLHVTGVDLSAEMLAQGRDKARQAGVGERVTFKEGDAQHIPFPAGSLDLVVSTLSMHHWGDPVAVLDEIKRVLRPGGYFLVLDLRRDVAGPIWLLLWFVTRCVVPRALRRIGEPLGSRDAAYTPREAAQLAQQSRLVDWQVTRGPLWLTVESPSRPRPRKQTTRPVRSEQESEVSTK